MFDNKDILKYGHNGDTTGIVWINNNDKIIYSQYRGGQQQFIIPFTRNHSMSISSISIDRNHTIIVEEFGNGSQRVHKVSESEQSSVLIKPLRALKIRYPYIALLYGTHELWVVPIDDPLQIHRYFFESNIIAIENT